MNIIYEKATNYGNDLMHDLWFMCIKFAPFTTSSNKIMKTNFKKVTSILFQMVSKN
jgi:hypothetical protein